MRIGFIGGAGHHYLRGLLTDPPAGLGALTVAVAGDGVDDDRARHLASVMSDAAWYDEPEAMLDGFRPDAVSVGAVYAHIGDWVAACLARGLPVVSDKPIAATWTQYERFTQLLADHPASVLLTEFNLRANRAFLAARQAVADGQVGDVALVTAQKSYRFGDARPTWYRQREHYGGTLLWIASHGIDAAMFVSGQAVTRVQGAQGNRTRPDYGSMEDHTITLLTFAGGGHAAVHADFLRPAKAHSHGDDRIRVAGSGGVVEVRDDRCMLTTHDQTEHDITGWCDPAPVAHQLLAALRGDRTVPFSTAASMEVARVLLHARDSADHGEAVAVS